MVTIVRKFQLYNTVLLLRVYILNILTTERNRGRKEGREGGRERRERGTEGGREGGGGRREWNYMRK